MVVGELDQMRPVGDFALPEGGLGFGIEAHYIGGQQRHDRRIGFALRAHQHNVLEAQALIRRQGDRQFGGNGGAVGHGRGFRWALAAGKMPAAGRHHSLPVTPGQGC